MAENSKKKGDFLEETVAFLHEIAGDRVQLKARIPVVDGSSRKREIDVLLTVENESLGDCPVYIPIECKNYGDPIGVEHIDAFVGKLHDLGIPAHFGIYVSASGYTSGALFRARTAGIKTLEARGLSADRLAVEIKDMLHSVIFWVATWTQTSHFDYLPGGASPSGTIIVELPADTENKDTGILNVIWRLWVSGKIPCMFDEYYVYVKFGNSQAAIATVQVSAHGASLPARVKSVSLAEAESGQTERRYVQGRFDLTSNSLKLTRFANDGEIEQTVSESGARLDLRTPRIIGPQMYWPPTKETARRVRELIERSEPVIFDAIEGPNLLRAWAMTTKQPN